MENATGPTSSLWHATCNALIPSAHALDAPTLAACAPPGRPSDARCRARVSGVPETETPASYERYQLVTPGGVDTDRIYR